MSCVKVIPQVQLRLESQNTADVFTTFTEWLAAMAMDDATITMKMWCTSNNFRATPAARRRSRRWASRILVLAPAHPGRGQ